MQNDRLNDRLKLKKVVWSIDAFEEKEDLQAKAARVLGVFQNKTYVQVEPVFVLGATELNWPVDYGTEWMRELQTNLRKHLEEVLMTVGFPHVLTPKIIVEPLASTSASVEALIDYAKEQKADLIIVSSHGRRGLDRFFLGSFAETLLVHSSLPVLVIGAALKQDSQLSQILFATDLGDSAREVFRQAVLVARQMGATLMIYHAVPVPPRIVMDSGYYPSLYGVEGEMVSLEDFLHQETELQSQRAQAWADWAQEEGVSCRISVELADQPVDELICKKVRDESCDLIIMEAQSGAMKAALLGSTTRNVVRAAPCPVLVFPRNSLKEKEPELPLERSERETTADMRDFEI